MTFHMLLRGLDGRTSCLRFPSSTIAGSLLQQQIVTILRIPAEAFLIVTGTRVINPHTFLYASNDGFYPSCILLLRLRGGKGGFGSLLRGAATKAGHKKTSNFNACRDMSGHRLRHVNAGKKLREWKAQDKERELEKTANEFLKKQVKQKKDESGCTQVIERFREETLRAREDVESAVARGLTEINKRLGKRKAVDESQPSMNSKHAHAWFSSEVGMGEEDSEDEDREEDSEDEDSENSCEDENDEEGSEADKAEQGSDTEKDER